MKNKTNATQKMTTLFEETNNAIENGYTENFTIEAKNIVIAGEHKSYSPEQIKISDFYRFEGYSDPQDNAILYLIETDDGTKGTLVDAYGAYADEKISKFIHEVESIQKESNNK